MKIAQQKPFWKEEFAKRIIITIIINAYNCRKVKKRDKNVAFPTEMATLNLIFIKEMMINFIFLISDNSIQVDI